MNIFLAGSETFTHNSIHLLSLPIPVTFLIIIKAENVDDMSSFLCLWICRHIMLTVLAKQLKCWKAQEGSFLVLTYIGRQAQFGKEPEVLNHFLRVTHMDLPKKITFIIWNFSLFLINTIVIHRAISWLVFFLINWKASPTSKSKYWYAFQNWVVDAVLDFVSCS